MSARARFVLWLYTGTFVLAMLYMVLFNPDDALGKSQTITWLGISVSTYPGQSAIVQFLGTFIAAMSVMPSLFKRRQNGSADRSVPIIATVGSAVIMIGQVLESIEEAPFLPDMAPPLVPAFLVVIVFYVAPIWILAELWPALKRFYAWLQCRRKSGG